MLAFPPTAECDPQSYRDDVGHTGPVTGQETLHLEVGTGRKALALTVSEANAVAATVTRLNSSRMEGRI